MRRAASILAWFACITCVMALGFASSSGILAQPSPDRSQPPESEPAPASSSKPTTSDTNTPPANTGGVAGRIRESEVTAGQLTPGDLERIRLEREKAAAKAAKEQSDKQAGNAASGTAMQAGPVKRNRAEVLALLEEMAGAYRSVCCPFQGMKDEKCPCHESQNAMLEFLLVQGYTREQADFIMTWGARVIGMEPGVAASTYNIPAPREKIPGSYDALTASYIEFVWARQHPRVVSFMQRAGEAGMPNAREVILKETYLAFDWDIKKKQTAQKGDNPEHVRTLGWTNGWGVLLQQAPNDPLIYLLPIAAGLVCIGVFLYGWRLMRARKQDSQQPGANPAPTPAPASGPVDSLNQRIEADARSLDDE